MVAIECTEHFSDLHRFDDGCEMLGDGRRERAAKIAAGIAIRPPRGHGVAHDLAATRESTVRSLDGAALLDSLQDSENCRCCQIGDWNQADPWEDVPLEAP